MHNVQFISVNVINTNNDIVHKFINTNHIQQIYQSGTNIIIELTDYTSLVIPDLNVHVFMDRFK
jgi:hypothetical protein